MRPELKERWNVSQVLTKDFDLRTIRGLAIEIVPEETTGENYRMAILNEHETFYPHSPCAMADLMEKMAFWLRDRFNPDGTLTEKGKQAYLKALGEMYVEAGT